MRSRVLGCAAMLAAWALPCVAEAEQVTAKIEVRKQKMSVYIDGRLKHEWKVSTAGNGYETPPGNYRPERLEKVWYSKQYDYAPMPFAVFYHAGYAIHGTDATGNLGRPASHGCIRLKTEHAARFFYLVRDHAEHNTKIQIED